MRTTIADAALGAGLLVASLLDLRSGRIPNLLTMPLIVLGIALASSLAEALTRGVIVLAALAIGYVFYAVGIVGGGDVKLVAAIAALKGGTFLVSTLIAASLVGLVVAVITLAHHHALIPFLSRLRVAVLDVIRYGFPTHPVIGEETHRIPYALVLAGGALLAYIGETRNLTADRIF
jgi:prepilin peptidase CpaA